MNGLIEMLFLDNCNEFAELVRTGDLDGLLLKPIDEQFLITCRRIDWGTAPNILMGAVVMVVALVQMHWHFELVRVVTFLVTFACGTAIAYSFMLLLTSLSVWMVRNQSLMEMWWLFSSLARYPKEIFAGRLGRAAGCLLHLLRADPGRGQRAGQCHGPRARPGDGRLHHGRRPCSCSGSAAGSSSTRCGPIAARAVEADHPAWSGARSARDSSTTGKDREDSVVAGSALIVAIEVDARRARDPAVGAAAFTTSWPPLVKRGLPEIIKLTVFAAAL